MANEDEKIVADYMGWTEISVEDPMNRGVFEYILLKHNNCEAHFDLNDAGLCVEEMQKRGDWEHDFMDFVAGSQKWNYHQCIAWLFNRENFFGAMAAWLKEGKK